ncbi:hypothetical protein AAC387_Pa05g1449 [Persea americana]
MSDGGVATWRCSSSNNSSDRRSSCLLLRQHSQSIPVLTSQYSVWILLPTATSEVEILCFGFSNRDNAHLGLVLGQ